MGFGSGFFFGGSFFQFGVVCFECSDVFGGGDGGFVLWQQEVMGVIVFDVYFVVQVVQVGDFFQQDDFYLSFIF